MERHAVAAARPQLSSSGGGGGGTNGQAMAGSGKEEEENASECRAPPPSHFCCQPSAHRLSRSLSSPLGPLLGPRWVVCVGGWVCETGKRRERRRERGLPGKRD
eukprot:scaffold21180_cov31-Tisochrysis_lutea.AAC.1